jgi:hypothetical protein
VDSFLLRPGGGCCLHATHEEEIESAVPVSSIDQGSTRVVLERTLLVPGSEFGCGGFLVMRHRRHSPGSSGRKVSQAFEFGAGSFGVALIVFAIASFYKPLAGHPLRPLALTNIIIALFIIRWVFPKIPRSRRKLELAYFSLLIISNFFAATSNAAVFLGRSLWFMSDLSIGLSTYVSDSPTNSLDTLGLYDLGLYFLAIGALR